MRGVVYCLSISPGKIPRNKMGDKFAEKIQQKKNKKERIVYNFPKS